MKILQINKGLKPKASTNYGRVLAILAILLFNVLHLQAQTWNETGNPGSPTSKLGTITPQPLKIVTNDSVRIFIQNVGGNVGIGTTKVYGFKLSVEGAIRARKVKVYPGTWSDDVFSKDFEMLTNEELENYLYQNKHLPNIPSEAEVKTSGVETGEMFNALLKEVEILNLRLLDLQKQLDAVKMKN